jgi:fructose-1,6-bisphosphatase/inositol monophosphatase family enzyme
VPVWSNLLALEVDGTVVLGVCNMPARQESYFAWLGGGAYASEKRISISGITEQSQASACARFLNFDGGSSIYAGSGIACVPALEPLALQFLGLRA